jgi:hypothetical protein
MVGAGARRYDGHMSETLTHDWDDTLDPPTTVRGAVTIVGVEIGHRLTVVGMPARRYGQPVPMNPLPWVEP